MNSKRFALVVMMGLAIAIGFSTSGFARKDASCITKCGLTYTQDLKTCPPANTSDMASIECGGNAKNTQQSCVDSCTEASTGTNASPSTKTK